MQRQQHEEAAQKAGTALRQAQEQSTSLQAGLKACTMPGTLMASCDHMSYAWRSPGKLQSHIVGSSMCILCCAAILVRRFMPSARLMLRHIFSL